MATLTILNLTAVPQKVQSLYATIAAGGTLVTERNQADVAKMPDLLQMAADGLVSYSVALSADESAASADQPEAMVYLGAPAAKSTTAVHAAFAGNNASNNYPGPFTSPAVPRNVTVTFAASWDGGDVTVVGTDQFGQAQSEVIADAAGTTVVGTKIFKTVTSATKQTVGAAADAASIGTGDKLGISTRKLESANTNLLAVDGVMEAGTWDATLHGVTPTTLPNGTRKYLVVARCKG